MTDIATTTGAEGPVTEGRVEEACSCCATSEEAAATVVSAPAGSGTTVHTYTVAGMTCEHCVHAVSTEIGKLPGVTAVDVDLPSGAVTVTSGAPLAHTDVAAAVDEAGYELVASENDTGPGR